jgi:pyrroline-5-carboxylate reductase
MKIDAGNKSIGFIGAGVMGAALIKSLISSSINAAQIYVNEKSDDRAKQVKDQYKINLVSIQEIGKSCDVIFLAVKPQDLSSALAELSHTLSGDALLISIAAGKTTKFIESQLKTGNSVIRVMPNTPAQIGKGVSAISPGKNTSAADLTLAKNLLSASGIVVEVSEADQDAVTALSGSGPAYFFSFIEAMVSAGVKLGLTNEIATQLAIGTISGSAAMLEESGLEATTLRKNVTSPNGTTAAALSVFTNKDLEKIVFDAMAAAKKRAQELA